MADQVTGNNTLKEGAYTTMMTPAKALTEGV